MHTASTVSTLLKQAHILLLVALMLTLLTACGDAREEIAKNSSGTMGDAADAALTNLEDVGLKRDDIPKKLAALVKNPYSTPKPLKCSVIKDEMKELDALLGPDLDAPKVALTDGEKYAEAGAELIHDGIVGFVRSQTSFLPFRGIIRSLTGAKKHEKAVAAAKEAGKLRRAYLKGLASAKFGTSCSFAPVVVAGSEAEETDDAAKKPKGKKVAQNTDSNLEVAAK